ncbi:MAG: patatin-like phospholipase family protein [Chloroflexales bacterium]|nr:patatin-like phospholipase family protein [Chloroflexales bacterium]
MTGTTHSAPHPRRVAVACQGGGSHTAFTAGVLKSLLRAEERADYKICALSGTSGGAICAALAWYGLLKVEHGEWHREQAVRILDDFWRDNAAQLPWERFWNDWSVGLIRLHMQGRLPELKASPYAPQAAVTSALLTQLAPRREFFDLRALLEKYLRLDEVAQPVMDPRLLIGAVGVLSGKFKAFDSLAAEISIDAVLASTTLPSLFQAIRIGDEIYWDGLFSQNPPVRELLLGLEVQQKPDEIWVVRINAQQLATEPTSVEEIEDRRNALAGNLSLNHELDVINKVNLWMDEGKFKSPHAKRIQIHWIEMSPKLSARLGYVTKLNRDPEFLAGLIADGEAQAEAFLARRASAVASV